MTPEERERIEDIRSWLPPAGGSINAEHVAWLLDLVERQEAKIAALQTNLELAGSLFDTAFDALQRRGPS